MSVARSHEKLVALFVIGIVLINYPLLHLFSEGGLILGIPVLYLYLFVCWLVLIGAIAFVMEHRGPADRPGVGGGEGTRE